jgi:hypothetical protein
LATFRPNIRNTDKNAKPKTKMPPKAEAGAGSDAFLVACIKCSKAKLEVDFDAVAKATGLSKGGAK